jgi:hypothetical protein
VIDLMVTLPRADVEHPAGYLFKDTPRIVAGELLPEMDRFNVEIGLIPVDDGEPVARSLLDAHPDRFLGCYQIDPYRVAGAVRAAVEQPGVVAAAVFAAGTVPQVAIDDPIWWPHYAACQDAGVPVFVNVGIPGPRWPGSCQHPMRLERVLADFTELTVVMRHGAEPWVAEAIALMRGWPNLHYSTSAFAPRYYPPEILGFANEAGADRVLYAGYFPSGLPLERIFEELATLPLAAHVWPHFLRTNAQRVLGLLG